jgi:hypothetical protein
VQSQIVFYKLDQKIVDDKKNVADNVKQVVYYALGIGHDLGVMDGFSAFLRMPLEGYMSWMRQLKESGGKRKLEGVLKWGEIEVNQSHTHELIPVLEESLSNMGEPEAGWTRALLYWLGKINEEPILYLMVRRAA